ncbi:MAG: 2-hydroxyacyl-CoA dehydratase subunit D [Anaerovoracaceae bacterium]|jgi:hypothetical protein
MTDIIHKYGAFIDRQVPRHPIFSRRLLVTGLRAYGFKLNHRPDPRLPQSRQYIASLLNDIVVDLLTHSEHAALTSVFMPCEMLQVMGIRSLCAELYSCFVNGTHAEKAFIETAEEEGIAETFCSYHKILLGSAYSGVLPKPAMIVNTSLVCDANNLTFRALSDHYRVPQFYLDVPPYDSDESVQYVAGQLRELKTYLEDLTHRAFDEEKLKETVARSGRTIENLRATQPLRRDHWLAGDIASELYEIYATHMGLGTPEAERYTEMLRRDFAAAPKIESGGRSGSDDRGVGFDHRGAGSEKQAVFDSSFGSADCSRTNASDSSFGSAGCGRANASDSSFGSAGCGRANVFGSFAGSAGCGRANVSGSSAVSGRSGRRGTHGTRILWIHTIPNWQEPVREMFNLSERAQIIGCDLNWDSLLPMDPQHPYESMARRLTASTFNGGGIRRIEAAIEMAEKLRADGAVIFCHWGCKQTMGLSTQCKKRLEEAGFPTLILNGDGCDESNSSDGQVATRLNAFMEMLEGKRR